MQKLTRNPNAIIYSQCRWSIPPLYYPCMLNTVSSRWRTSPHIAFTSLMWKSKSFKISLSIKNPRQVSVFVNHHLNAKLSQLTHALASEQGLLLLIIYEYHITCTVIVKIFHSFTNLTICVLVSAEIFQFSYKIPPCICL